jgi:hypothetical protein
MDELTQTQKRTRAREMERIFTSNLEEIEKLKQGFAWITNQVIEQTEKEMELLKALNDQETLVKEQIKVSTIKYAQSIFQECYRRALAKRGLK